MELLLGLGQAVVWCVLGVALLAAGFVATDLVTPGKLGQLVYRDANRNACYVVASNLVAVGLIVTTSILTSADGFMAGIVSAAAYGVIGVVVLAVAVLVADVLVPGDLRDVVTRPELHPGTWVLVAFHLALGGVLAAAIS